jgi:hypothetical protein
MEYERPLEDVSQGKVAAVGWICLAGFVLMPAARFHDGLALVNMISFLMAHGYLVVATFYYWSAPRRKEARSRSLLAAIVGVATGVGVVYFVL